MVGIDEVLKDLKARVTCSACNDIFTDPKVTPCLHTFCCGCLNDLGKRNPYSSVIHCPVCEAEVDKPDGINDFSCYPSNIYITRLLEVYLAKLGIIKEGKCGRCQTRSEILSFCFDCSLFMCARCVCNTSTATNNHRVVKLGEFGDKDLEDLLVRPITCVHDINEGCPVEVFCRHCDQCICIICSIQARKEHNNVISLKDEVEEATQLITEAASGIKERIDHIKCGKSEIQQRLDDLDKQVDIVKQEVLFGIEKLVQLLKQHELEMVQQLEGVRDVKRENLNSQLEAFDISLVQAQNSIDFVQSMLHRNIPAEVATLKAPVINRLQQLLRMTTDSRPIESACVGYVPNKDVLRHIHSSPLGHIASSNTDLRSSSATGYGLVEVAVGEEAMFTVITRDMKGIVCYSSIDTLNVQIRSSEDVKLQAAIKDTEAGIYDVSYTPKTPGKYEVVVQVGGKDIGGSPFLVPVQPPVIMPVKLFGSHAGMAGQFTHPHGIAVSETGEIAVSDTQKNCVHLFDEDGKKLMVIGEYGTEESQLNYPAGVAFDKANKNLLVADRDNHRIQVFNRKTGKLVKKFGIPGSADGQFNKPNGISVDKQGRMIITDWHNHRVQVFSSEGRFLFKFGTSPQDKLKHPRDAIFSETDKTFIVSDTGNNVIKVYDKKGKFLNTIGKPGNKKGELFSPRGLVIDKTARLIVCDFDNHRLQFFKMKDGSALNSFGCRGTQMGQFVNPMGVVLLNDEQLIVTDWRNDRIQVFSMGPQWKMAYLCDVGSSP